MQRPTPERRTAMIYDKLENIGRYKGMNKHLDTAIDYILHNDLSSLPSGRTELDGDNVYINVMEAAAGPLETRKYEIHKKYKIGLDQERINLCPSKAMTPHRILAQSSVPIWLPAP